MNKPPKTDVDRALIEIGRLIEIKTQTIQDAARDFSRLIHKWEETLSPPSAREQLLREVLGVANDKDRKGSFASWPRAPFIEALKTSRLLPNLNAPSAVKAVANAFHVPSFDAKALLSLIAAGLDINAITQGTASYLPWLSIVLNRKDLFDVALRLGARFDGHCHGASLMSHAVRAVAQVESGFWKDLQAAGLDFHAPEPFGDTPADHFGSLCAFYANSALPPALAELKTAIDQAILARDCVPVSLTTRSRL